MNEASVVAAAEVAAMLGVSRQRVTQLTAKADFPAPVTTLSVGKIWSYDDVRSWAEATGRTLRPLPQR